MSNIVRPFSLVPLFGDWDNELNRLFNNRFGSPTVESSDWLPSVDVLEEAKEFIVKVDLPGVDVKDVDISVDQNVLVISGNREAEHKEKKENFVRYERVKGSFHRRITLPDMIDAEKIAAKAKNGVIEIMIPKTDKSVSRKIKIEE